MTPFKSFFTLSQGATDAIKCEQNYAHTVTRHHTNRAYSSNCMHILFSCTITTASQMKQSHCKTYSLATPMVYMGDKEASVRTLIGTGAPALQQGGTVALTGQHG